MIGQDGRSRGTVRFPLLLTFCLLWCSGSPLAAAELDARLITLLTTKCIQCHAAPQTGAPRMGVPEDWQAVRDQGEETTLINVVQGLRGMPPLGYCSACSEQDLRALIRFIAGFPATEAGEKQ